MSHTSNRVQACIVFFGAAAGSSPAGRNAGEIEVTEFPLISCRLLATRAQFLEEAWAGKGSKRGSGLLLLAQKPSQQLQSHCEVMPGAARELLQVETDSGPKRRGHARRAGCPCPAPLRRASGGLELVHPAWSVPQAPVPPRRATHQELQALSRSWRMRPSPPWSLTSLPRCCRPAETGSGGASEEAAGAEAGTQLRSSTALAHPGCSCTRGSH